MPGVNGGPTQPDFFDLLQARVASTGSALCIGLDPRADSVDALREQCGRLIEATADFAVAYKPNSAFFEAHGPEGMLALLDVIATVPDDIPVLLDAKRGDIATTSVAYARAAFDTLGALALTVSPYVGLDGMRPLCWSRPPTQARTSFSRCRCRLRRARARCTRSSPSTSCRPARPRPTEMSAW